MFAETILRSEDDTRRTRGARMAIVLNRMIAWVLARTWIVAGRTLGTARNGWIDHIRSTLAVELVKGAPVAWRAVAAVAGLVAFVLAARQGVVAGHRADVIDIDAAFLRAFVLATAALLRTTFLAARIVRPSDKLTTLDHLVHVPAAAANGRLLAARRTVA